MPTLPATRTGLLKSVPTLLLAESSALLPEASSNFHQLIKLAATGGAGSCTVRRKLLLALSGPSLTITVIVAVPVWFVAGVTRMVRLEPLPPKLMLATGVSVGFDDAALRVSAAAALSGSPMVNGRSAVAWFLEMVTPAMTEMAGASLTGVTVSRNDLLTGARPSVTVTVTSVVPD